MSSPWPESPDEMSRIYQSAVAEHGKAHAVSALCREYGIPNRTVYGRLERAGIIRASQPPDRPAGPELQKLAESLHDPDAPHRTLPKVAAVLGVSDTTARRWLTEAGIPVENQQRRGPRMPIAGNCPCGSPAVARYKGEEPPLCMPCYQKQRSKDGPAHRRNGRLEVAAFKEGKPCADCGGMFPPCVMDLDHVPERGPKLFNLGQPERNLKEVRAELAKCDLVCANCHRIRTWKRRQAKNAQAAS